MTELAKSHSIPLKVEVKLETCFGCLSIVNHKFIFEGGIITKEMFSREDVGMAL
jgi:hypothetical protein